jgi:hypothetical protein
MARYTVQHYSRTLVALARIAEQQTFPLPFWTFNFPANAAKVALLDSVRKTDKINLHIGLDMITTLRAKSVDEAVETAKGFVEILLNLVSFSCLTFCDAARLVSVMSILDTNTKVYPVRHYVYPFEGAEILGSPSVIKEPTFGAIFEAYGSNSYKPRVGRALSWLRKGIGEDGSVDEFICYWIGLEVIKHVLSSEETNTAKEWEEVEEVFHKRLNRQDFKKIKQAGRNGLLHGFRQVDKEFVEEIKSYVEPIRRTLVFCIGSVLGLKDSILLTIANKTPRRIRKNPWGVITGEIRDIPENFDEIVENYPRVDAEIVNKSFSIDDKGEIGMKFSIHHHFRGPSSAKWKLEGTELWGDRDAGVKKLELEND